MLTVMAQYFNGRNMNDMSKIAHGIKHSHGRCVVGAFDKILHEGNIWTGHRAVLYFILHIYIFINFLYRGAKFQDR